MRRFTVALLVLGACGPDAPASHAPPPDTSVAVSPSTVSLPDSARDAPPVATPAPDAAAHAPIPSDTLSPDVRAALVVIDAYYAAIRGREYARAYQLWADRGRASGKSYAAFAQGFANTVDTRVTTGEPGRVEGAAGSRFVDVPVTVVARTRDGTVQRFRGTYALRRVAVDGATEAQRKWHLYSANLVAVP